MSAAPAGTVAELWRFPVKSMQGESVEEAPVSSTGILGDRALALRDTATGAVPSSSDAKLFSELLKCRAGYTEAVTPGAVLPAVRITLPDGSTTLTTSPELPDLLHAHFGRRLALVDTPPAEYSARQAKFFAKHGLGLPPTANLADLAPLSIITSSTLGALATARPGVCFDLQRFRMNIAIRTGPGGFIENDWVGRRLEIGRTVQIAVSMADPRCVVTTLPQGNLPKDPSILKTIARVNSVTVGTGGPLPCLGVYARVLSPGVIRLGDPVMLS